LASLFAGYHVIEKKLLKELNIKVKHISIVEFLRKINSGLQGSFLVSGLEEAAKLWDNPDEFAKYLRRKLRTITEEMIKEGCIVIFTVEDIVGEEKAYLTESKLNLAKIFGADRLERISKGHFYSTPNIP